MAKSKNYLKLIEKRTNYVRALSFHGKTINDLNPDAARSKIYASVTLPLIETSFERYKSIHEQLEDEDEFEYDDLEPKDEIVVESFITSASKLKEILGESGTPQNLNSTSIQNQSQGHIIHDLKLPTMTIPTFNGDFDEWND